MWIWTLICLEGACSRAQPPPPTQALEPVVPAEPKGVDPAPIGEIAPPISQRLVAVGDLHADLDNAVHTLQLTGLVDADGHWIGGTAVLVQTGDTTDRGPDSRPIMKLLRQLQIEAAVAGGRVVPLLGNHEVMNLVGDWRYVHPDDVATYGGVEARTAAFAADGEDGKWLRGLDVVTRVGDTVFAHGGVTREYAALGIDEVNRRAHRALAEGDGKAPVLGATGPLWYRGYVRDDETTACPALDEALGLLGARRMVVGHTTRRDGRIEARCDGALLVIDIGIADHYGAHLGAVDLSASDGRALYPEGPTDLPDP